MTTNGTSELSAAAAPDELAAWRSGARAADIDATPESPDENAQEAIESDRLPGSPDPEWADENPQDQTDG